MFSSSKYRFCQAVTYERLSTVMWTYNSLMGLYIKLIQTLNAKTAHTSRKWKLSYMLRVCSRLVRLPSSLCVHRLCQIHMVDLCMFRTFDRCPVHTNGRRPLGVIVAVLVSLWRTSKSAFTQLWLRKIATSCFLLHCGQNYLAELSRWVNNRGWRWGWKHFFSLSSPNHWMRSIISCSWGR